MKTDIKNLYQNYMAYEDEEVTVEGWIKTIRSSNAFGFIELNDGTYFNNIQIVLENENLSNYADICKSTVYTAVSVKGILKVTPEMKQPFEIKAQEVTVLANSENDYPLQKKTAFV